MSNKEPLADYLQSGVCNKSMFFNRIALLFKYFCIFAFVLKQVSQEQDCIFKL